MESGTWKGMMVVMPTLTETQQAHNPFVTALVGRLELALAKGVADGIHTPHGMMSEKNTHQSTPEETCPPSNQEWDSESQCHPQQGSIVDEDHNAVLE